MSTRCSEDENSQSQTYLDRDSNKTSRSISSLETTTEKTSTTLDNLNIKQGIKKFLQRRRLSLSSSSIKSETTVTNVIISKLKFPRFGK